MRQILKREFCAENATWVAQAIANGADRIELCDNLAVGGTTPSLGVIEAVAELASHQQVDVMVMIRPRGGNYTYTASEVAIMQRDIQAIQSLAVPVSGFVLGALRADERWVDEAVLTTLMSTIQSAATPYQVTFHMAFDRLPLEQQSHALDWLAGQGFTRVLTHGGSMERPILDNLDQLRLLSRAAKDKLILLPGGGITATNAEIIAQELHVNEVHGTKIVPLIDD